MGSSRLCYDPRPVDKELCYTPCDNDCVTSSWSDWSACSADCGVGRQAGYRTRHKTILAQANSGTPHNSRIALSRKHRIRQGFFNMRLFNTVWGIKPEMWRSWYRRCWGTRLILCSVICMRPVRLFAWMSWLYTAVPRHMVNAIQCQGLCLLYNPKLLKSLSSYVKDS